MPAMEVAPVSSKAAAAICATTICVAWNWALAWAELHAHLGQPGLGGGELLAGLIELLG